MAHIAQTHKIVRSILLSTALLLGLTQEGYGFAEIYRGALTLDLEGRIIYDSNVSGNAIGNAGDLSDMLFSLRPMLRYERDVGRSDINAWFGLDFSRYQDFTDINFNDFDLGFTVDAPTAPGSKFTGNIDFRYNQDTGSNQSVLRYVQTQRFHFNVDGSYMIGTRTSLRFGAGYRIEDPKDIIRDPPVEYSQSTYYDVTLGVGYNLRSINTLFLDYRRRASTSDNQGDINTGRDYVSDALFLGISRPLGGKLHGTASIGYETTDDREEGDVDADRWILNANLTWTPREKTTLGLQIGRQLNISGYNTGYYNTTVTVTANQDIGQRWSLDGRLGYSWYDYESDRDDQVLDFRIGLSYAYNSRLSGGIDYEYRDSSSNNPLGEYTRNRVSLRVSYTF
ncbi:MAG: hypothetical protein DRP71_05390 [Verrucomicrobia bacterium]|nr:MAG: hypothetical protein DRP71_05390 [Verrucomicrobiota bacterium]